MVVLVLIFRGPFMLFSIADALIDILTDSRQGLRFLYTLLTLVISYFFF